MRFFPRFFSRRLPDRRSRGFTLIEMIVVMGITAFILMISVINFETARSRDLVQAAALTATDLLRSAQNYAVSGTLPGADSDVKGYGVHFDINEQKAILFQEKGDSNMLYNSGEELETKPFDIKKGQKKFVTLSDVQIEGRSAGDATIFFEKGDGRVSVNGQTDSAAPRQIELFFKHEKLGDAETKTVTVNRVTGRIDYSY